MSSVSGCMMADTRVWTLEGMVPVALLRSVLEMSLTGHRAEAARRGRDTEASPDPATVSYTHLTLPTIYSV